VQHSLFFNTIYDIILEVNETIFCLEERAPNPQRPRKIRIHPANLSFGYIKNSIQHLLHIRFRLGVHATGGADVRGKPVLQTVEEASSRDNPAIL